MPHLFQYRGTRGPCEEVERTAANVHAHLLGLVSLPLVAHRCSPASDVGLKRELVSPSTLKYVCSAQRDAVDPSQRCEYALTIGLVFGSDELIPLPKPITSKLPWTINAYPETDIKTLHPLLKVHHHNVSRYTSFGYRKT